MWFSVRTGGPMWASAPTGCIPFNGPVPAAGHTGLALQDHTEPGPGGAEGPLALSPQQCEAWIERVTAPIQSHRTKPLKKLKIPKFKSFTRFFSKNRRGPGGSAPGRASQGAKHPPVATGEIPAGRSQRNSRAAHGAKPPPVATWEAPPAAGFPIAPAPRS